MTIQIREKNPRTSTIHVYKQSRQSFSYVYTLLEQYKAIVNICYQLYLSQKGTNIYIQCNWVDWTWDGRASIKIQIPPSVFFSHYRNSFAVEELWNQRQLRRLIIWTTSAWFRMEGWDKLPFPLPCTAKTVYRKCETNNPRNETARPLSQFMFLRAIYIFPRLVCLFCCRKIGGPIVGIYIQTTVSLHESDIFAVCPLLVPLKTTTFTKVAFVLNNVSFLLPFVRRHLSLTARGSLWLTILTAPCKQYIEYIYLSVL